MTDFFCWLAVFRVWWMIYAGMMPYVPRWYMPWHRDWHGVGEFLFTTSVNAGFLSCCASTSLLFCAKRFSQFSRRFWFCDLLKIWVRSIWEQVLRSRSWNWGFLLNVISTMANIPKCHFEFPESKIEVTVVSSEPVLPHNNSWLGQILNTEPGKNRSVLTISLYISFQAPH